MENDARQIFPLGIPARSLPGEVWLQLADWRERRKTAAPSVLVRHQTQLYL